MKKTNELSLKEAINQLLDTYRLRDGINEVRVKKAWIELMGQAVVNRTTDIQIRGGDLILKISSAPLKVELTYQKDKIRMEMNRLLEGDFIKEVRVL